MTNPKKKNLLTFVNKLFELGDYIIYYYNDNFFFFDKLFHEMD